MLGGKPKDEVFWKNTDGIEREPEERQRCSWSLQGRKVEKEGSGRLVWVAEMEQPGKGISLLKHTCQTEGQLNEGGTGASREGHKP